MVKASHKDWKADNIRSSSNDASIVIMACQNGHTEIGKLLLDRGTDYNKVNNHA